MNSQLQKQIIIGALAGLLISGVAVFLLSGKRGEIKVLAGEIEKLDLEVKKGIGIKQNVDRLKVEIASQKKRIEELVKIMPNEQDRGELPYRIKKLSDTAGIEQQAFTNENPVKQPYYTEYPVKFEFKAGYHSFGQLASLVSGYEKIINLTDLTMTRDTASRGIFTAKVTCKVSAFLYNPNAVVEPKPAAPNPVPAPAPTGKGGKGKDKGDE